MSSVRGTNTKPELLLRKALWRRGLRYRLNSALPGKPDIVLARYKIAIFVDGCFWHSCPVHGSLPETNMPFWKNKIARNIERDNESKCTT
ncbi:very short patch repair endonuclease [Nitrosomonas ureae]|uniref:very short patch repair endonuclease n=1 Tax=Nitrosomonas ureae TaxID=44577 RepID=UPI0020D1D1FC|nr:very short patch repair endonuclease [Nitrosomonas ureae]